MNKLKLAALSIGLMASGIFSYAQNGKENVVYRESIELHINTDFLITGETLYYSVYCLDDKKNRFSSLSKLAFVELIGENEEPYLQSKVPLTEGSGAGDFFLPSTLPSGNYTLIAYTKWMRNFPVENFFQKQITIVNPYLKSFNPGTQSNSNEINSSILSFSRKKIDHTNHVQISSDQKKYSYRQKVVVVIKNNDLVYDCKLSLSVHTDDKGDAIRARSSKFDSLKELSVNSIVQAESHKEDLPITFLPDLRGETIGGIVRERVSHQLIANTNIYLSAWNPSHVFQISRTDSTGRFYFSTKNIQTQTGIQFQMEGKSESSLEVILDDEFINDYKVFKPLPFSIDTALREPIEQRNVYSQIENAYYIKKRDSVLEVKQLPFFGKPDKVYSLDDFTRFPTMEDVFREFVFEVIVSKREKKFTLQLINSRNGSRFSNPPLILLDGIQIFDTQILMNYNPLLIKTMSLITKQYVYAGILFDGILSIDTYQGNAKELPVVSIQNQYTSWQRSKKYYSPMYNVNNSLERIPDYRVQLFWNPAIQIEAGQEIKVEFYTSDVAGDFLIETKGFNSKGELVNIHQIIEVRK